MAARALTFHSALLLSLLAGCSDDAGIGADGGTSFSSEDAAPAFDSTPVPQRDAASPDVVRMRPDAEVPDVIASLPYLEWRPISLNTIRDVDPCPESRCAWSAVEGQSGVINDWTGGAFATEEGGLGGLVYWGGGHNGYYGTEVYFFDLATLTWQRRGTTTDGMTSGDATTFGLDAHCRFWDGNPIPFHTFESPMYDSARNRFWVLTVADVVSHPPGSVDGCSSNRPAAFDFATDRWIDATAEGPLSFKHAATAYDSERDLFWGYTANTPATLVSYDPATDAFTVYERDSAIATGLSGAIDPVRDLFVVLDFRVDPRIRVRQLNDPEAPAVFVERTGDTEIEAHTQLGFEWSPELAAFVVWKAHRDIYLLTPPGAWDSEPWTWTRLTLGGDDPGEPVNGPYSKFQYVPSLGIALVCNAIDEPVYAARLVP